MNVFPSAMPVIKGETTLCCLVYTLDDICTYQDWSGCSSSLSSSSSAIHGDIREDCIIQEPRSDKLWGSRLAVCHIPSGVVISLENARRLPRRLAREMVDICSGSSSFFFPIARMYISSASASLPWSTQRSSRFLTVVSVDSCSGPSAFSNPASARLSSWKELGVSLRYSMSALADSTFCLTVRRH